jgi:hypothetical protein
MTASALDTLLAKSAKKWDAYEKSEACDLLRLAVLRELVHSLHAEKSRFLSSGKSKDAASLTTIEARVEELRLCKPLTGNLIQLLNANITLKRATTHLPESLFKVLDRQKLERYDRMWELSLTSEALAQGWGIWALEALVDMTQVDEWHQVFNRELEPSGIILYVESAENAETSSRNRHSWPGRWICVLNPRYRAGSEIPVDFKKFPQTPQTGASKHPPVWRLLYSEGK